MRRYEPKTLMHSGKSLPSTCSKRSALPPSSWWAGSNALAWALDGRARQLALAVGDLGDLQDRRDRHGHAVQLAGGVERPQEVAEGRLHGRSAYVRNVEFRSGRSKKAEAVHCPPRMPPMPGPTANLRHRPAPRGEDLQGQDPRPPRRGDAGAPRRDLRAAGPERRRQEHAGQDHDDGGPAHGIEGTLLGRPIGHKPTLRRVGYLPEHHRFPPYLTGRQALGFYAALSKVGKQTRRQRADELLGSDRDDRLGGQEGRRRTRRACSSAWAWPRP